MLTWLDEGRPKRKDRVPIEGRFEGDIGYSVDERYTILAVISWVGSAK